jgi:hypothetical protein
MKLKSFVWTAGLPLLFTVMTPLLPAAASDLYVSPTGGNVPPFDDWATAATNIQIAIDVASPGDRVWVTNGTYNTGLRTVGINQFTSNRVAVTKPISLQSVNGPDVTFIDGFWAPGYTNRNLATRCVWLGTGAQLAGFTLANGATAGTEPGGGVYCQSAACLISNCVITGNSSGGNGGGVYQGAALNCTFSNNVAASSGGGSYDTWATNCLFLANQGGGLACSSNGIFISDCALIANSGGGAFHGTLFRCLVEGNTGNFGGGLYQGFACACLFRSNTASSGGALYNSWATNCALVGNRATLLNQGGGLFNGAALNCTIVNNSNGPISGTAWALNSILYYNLPFQTGPATLLTNCCVDFPISAQEPGTFNADPTLFSDGIHLRLGSPCIGRGAPGVTGPDIDGQPLSSPPSVGCDQWQPQLVLVAQPRVRPGSGPGTARLVVEVAGQQPSCLWFKDGVPLTEGSHYVHAQSPEADVPGFDVPDAGAYQVIITNAFGALTSAIVNVNIACVDAASSAPAPPYADWSTAAQTIQDAADVAGINTVVLVTNGVYGSGARYVTNDMTNRVVITQPVTLLSRGGPDQTVIEGAWDPSSTNGPASVRCVWLADGAELGGFTLRDGSTPRDGGGIWSVGPGWQETMAQCVVTNCRSAGDAGGVYLGHLRDCAILANVAAGNGGGAAHIVASNCQFVANAAGSGGGVYEATLNGCSLLGNVSSYAAGALNSQAQNCLLATNAGPGARQSQLYGCTVLGNSGSGAQFSLAESCFFRSNSPYGAFNCTNLNCTFVQNAQPVWATATSPTVNSVLWFNWNPSTTHTLSNCVASPGEAASEPLVRFFPNLLSDGYHLATNSPCLERAVSAATPAADIDGQPFNSKPAVGCVDWHPQLMVVAQPLVFPGDTNGSAIVRFELAGQDPYCWWTKDGAPLENSTHYASAHSASLRIQGFDVADAGAYQVIASNSLSVLTSAVVQVQIACVGAASASPAAPYSGWSTAARTIQDAVDAAAPGTVVLVTNGVYNAGGRFLAGDMTNRVVLDKAVTVLSRNGAGQTIIEGAWDPVATNGPASVRCAWIGEGAVLGGFTLRNGSTPGQGGGLWCTDLGLQETAVCCVITNCQAGTNGGGAFQGRLRHCTLAGNQAKNYGGGAYLTVLDACLVQNNFAPSGGGLASVIARSCRILQNSASGFGGGVGGNGSFLSKIDGCLLAWNQAASAAGAYNADLVNCTVVSNSAVGGYVGGVDFCNAENCVLYFNQGGPQFGGLYVNAGGSAGFADVCYWPFRADVGAFTNNPELVDIAHIATTSPCRGAGIDLGIVGFSDIDGEVWASPPSVGCDEPIAANLNGPLSVVLSVWPQVAAGGVMPLVGTVQGRASELVWSFGDENVVSNASFATAHSWTVPGTYTVTLTAYNNDFPNEVVASASVNVVPLALPLLSAIPAPGAQLSLEFQGQPGLSYELQSATSLAAPISWQTVTSLDSVAGPATLLVTNLTSPALYYRLQVHGNGF